MPHHFICSNHYHMTLSHPVCKKKLGHMFIYIVLVYKKYMQYLNLWRHKLHYDVLAYLIFKTPYLRDIQGKRSSSGTIIIVLNAWIKFDDLVIWPLKYLMIAFILPTLQRWLHEKLIQIYICAKTSWNWNPIYQAVMHYRKGEILTQSVRG